MVLDAVLRLDAAGFNTPLGISVQGVQTLIRMVQDVGQEFQAAFDLGGMLTDIASATGEGVGEIMVLRQAFQDTGVGAENLDRTLSIMRRSIGGISESGEPTVKMFDQLGLSVDALKGMGAREQIETIAAAINNLETPAQQSAAAMTIFGRSGAKMLSLMKDPAAFDVAAKSLGELPALMDRSAWAFDSISDRMGRIREKSTGLWAGMAEGLLPVVDGITEALDGIDLTGVGMKIGAVIGTLAEGISVAADWWRGVFSTAIDWWGGKIASVMSWWKEKMPAIGSFLWDVLKWPVAQLSAAFGWVIQHAMELIGKIPRLGEKLGLKGFEAQSWSELVEQADDDIDGVFTKVADAVVYVAQGVKDAVGQTVETAAFNWRAKMEKIEAEARPGKTYGTASLEAAGKEKEKEKQGRELPRIDTDALARIGGYLGGGGRTMEGLAMRTAKAAEELLRLAQSNTGSGRAAVWAT